MLEVEVKALVPDPKLLTNLISSQFKVEGVSSRQLNHYFSYSTDVLNIFLKQYLSNLCAWNDEEFPEDVITASDLAIRTRWDSLTGTWLMLKYSIDGECSQNGTTRQEFECNIKEDLSTLDNTLLVIGCEYQSKWSRDRTEFKISDDVRIFVDVNAGYHGICEVEKLIMDKEELAQAKAEVKKVLGFLELDELESGLLKEMFNFYSANWKEFYGTQNSIFEDRRFQAILGSGGK
jgi:adenylate cyclase class IV